MGAEFFINARLRISDTDAKKQVKSLLKGVGSINVPTRNLQKVTKETQKVAAGMKKVKGAIPIAAMEEFERSGGSAGDRIAKSLGLATGSAESFGVTIGVVIRRFAAFAIASRILVGLQNIIGGAVRSLVSFEQGLANLQKVSVAARKDTSKFALAQLNLTISFKTTIEAVQELQLEFARQGRTAVETAALTESALLSMNAAGLTANDALELLTITTNVFGISAENSASTIDKLTALADKNAITVQDLTEAYRRSGAIFAAANISFEESASLITIVRENSRLSARQIGTAFKSIIPSIINAQEQLEDMGVVTRNTKGEFDFTKTILNLNRQLASVPAEKRVQLTTKLVGKRQAARFISLLENITDIEEDLEIQANAAGTALEKQDVQFGTFASTIQGLRNEVLKLTVVLADLGFGDFFKLSILQVTKLVEHMSLLASVIKNDKVQIGFLLSTMVGLRVVLPIVVGLIKGVREFFKLVAIGTSSVKELAATIKQTEVAQKGVTAAVFSTAEAFEVQRNAAISARQASMASRATTGKGKDAALGLTGALIASSAITRQKALEQSVRGSSKAFAVLGKGAKLAGRNLDILGLVIGAVGTGFTDAGSAANDFFQVVSAAAMGASFGRIFGPWGMAIGALGGAMFKLLGLSSKVDDGLSGSAEKVNQLTDAAKEAKAELSAAKLQSSLEKLATKISVVNEKAKQFKFELDVAKVKNDINNIISEIERLPQQLRVPLIIEQNITFQQQAKSNLEKQISGLRNTLQNELSKIGTENVIVADLIGDFFKALDRADLKTAGAIKGRLGELKDLGTVSKIIDDILSKTRKQIIQDENINKLIAQRKVALQKVSESINEDVSDIAFQGIDLNPVQKAILDINKTIGKEILTTKKAISRINSDIVFKEKQRLNVLFLAKKELQFINTIENKLSQGLTVRVGREKKIADLQKNLAGLENARIEKRKRALITLNDSHKRFVKIYEKILVKQGSLKDPQKVFAYSFKDQNEANKLFKIGTDLAKDTMNFNEDTASIKKEINRVESEKLKMQIRQKEAQDTIKQTDKDFIAIEKQKNALAIHRFNLLLLEFQEKKRQLIAEIQLQKQIQQARDKVSVRGIGVEAEIAGIRGLAQQTFGDGPSDRKLTDRTTSIFSDGFNKLISQAQKEAQRTQAELKSFTAGLNERLSIAADTGDAEFAGNQALESTRLIQEAAQAQQRFHALREQALNKEIEGTRQKIEIEFQAAQKLLEAGNKALGIFTSTRSDQRRLRRDIRTVQRVSAGGNVDASDLSIKEIKAFQNVLQQVPGDFLIGSKTLKSLGEQLKLTALDGLGARLGLVRGSTKTAADEFEQASGKIEGLTNRLRSLNEELGKIETQRAGESSSLNDLVNQNIELLKKTNAELNRSLQNNVKEIFKEFEKALTITVSANVLELVSKIELSAKTLKSIENIDVNIKTPEGITTTIKLNADNLAGLVEQLGGKKAFGLLLIRLSEQVGPELGVPMKREGEQMVREATGG